MNEKYQEMILEKIHVAGVEEWYCPICGRRFLVQWPPAYELIVLSAGDKDIRHNVSKNNSCIGSRPVTEPSLDPEVFEWKMSISSDDNQC